MIDFTPLLLTDKIAVCFDNEAQAVQFLQELKIQHNKWFGGTDVTYWDRYEEQTCYAPKLRSGHGMTFGRRVHYKSIGYAIIHFLELRTEEQELMPTEYDIDFLI